MGDVISFVDRLSKKEDSQVFIADNGDEVTMGIAYPGRTVFTGAEVMKMRRQLELLGLTREKAELGEIKASPAAMVDLRSSYRLRNLMQRLNETWLAEELAGTVTATRGTL